MERRRFGFCSRHMKLSGRNRVTVRDANAGDVPELLRDIREYYGDGEVRLWVDERGLDADLGPALVEAGLHRDSAAVYLAHVGETLRAPEVEGLLVALVEKEELYDFAVTKLKAFDSSEEEPTPESVEHQTAVCAEEMKGEARFMLARLEGEPAAILSYYEGEDHFIFQLATRLPFRGRGIARKLLCDSLAEAYGSGSRSALISADEEDWPVGFYRRLGFVDEIYWRRLYTLPALG